MSDFSVYFHTWAGIREGWSEGFRLRFDSLLERAWPVHKLFHFLMSFVKTPHFCPEWPHSGTCHHRELLESPWNLHSAAPLPDRNLLVSFSLTLCSVTSWELVIPRPCAVPLPISFIFFQNSPFPYSCFHCASHSILSSHQYPRFWSVITASL